MAITKFLDPSSMPSRTQDQQTFDNNMATFMQDFPVAIQQINATEAGMNSIAAGGAYAIPYTFDGGTAYADPGGGKLRLNNASPGSASGLFISTTSAQNKLVAAYIDSMNGSSSAVKGTVRIQAVADPSRYLIGNLTAIDSTNNGYRALTYSFVSMPGGTVFAAGESVVLFFQRTGDKGDTGTGSMQLLASANISTPVANIDFLNIFTVGYDKCVIDTEGLTLAANAIVTVLVAKGGVVDGGASYNFGSAGSNTTSVGTTSHLASANGTKHTGATTIMNALDATANSRLIHSVTMTYNSGASPVTQSINYTTCYTPAGALSGFRLAVAGTTFTAGIVRVYGIKNS